MFIFAQKPGQIALRLKVLQVQNMHILKWLWIGERDRQQVRVKERFGRATE